MSRTIFISKALTVTTADDVQSKFLELDLGVIEAIALRRAYRLKGGAPDFEKAAHTLLLDYRSGALGRISLETPANRVALLASYQPPPSLAEPQEVFVEDDTD